MQPRDDHGSTSLELALACPVLAVLAALGIQVALWLHAQNVAQAAAREGARAAAVAEARPGDAEERTRQVLAGLGPQMLDDVTITATQTASTTQVQVKGRTISLVPGLTWHVNEQARQHREQFRPDNR